MPVPIKNPTPEQLAHRLYNRTWWRNNKDRFLKKRRDETAKKRAAKGLPPVKGKNNDEPATKKSVPKKATKKKITKKKPAKKKLTKAQVKANHKIQNDRWREKVRKEKAAQQELERQRRINEYNKQFK